MLSAHRQSPQSRRTRRSARSNASVVSACSSLSLGSRIPDRPLATHTRRWRFSGPVTDVLCLISSRKTEYGASGHCRISTSDVGKLQPSGRSSKRRPSAIDLERSLNLVFIVAPLQRLPARLHDKDLLRRPAPARQSPYLSPHQAEHRAFRSAKTSECRESGRLPGCAH